MATRHLRSLGHRRIGCIAGPSGISPSAARATGYRQALTDAEIAFDETLVCPVDFHSESGWQAVLRLLQLPDRPTAIFACNDLMALGVLRAAAERGARA